MLSRTRKALGAATAGTQAVRRGPKPPGSSSPKLRRDVSISPYDYQKRYWQDHEARVGPAAPVPRAFKVALTEAITYTLLKV